MPAGQINICQTSDFFNRHDSFTVCISVIFLIFCRAEIYRQQNNVDEAIMNYRQAIMLDPKDHEAFFRRAEMYEKVKLLSFVLETK